MLTECCSGHLLRKVLCSWGLGFRNVHCCWGLGFLKVYCSWGLELKKMHCSSCFACAFPLLHLAMHVLLSQPALSRSWCILYRDGPQPPLHQPGQGTVGVSHLLLPSPPCTYHSQYALVTTHCIQAGATAAITTATATFAPCCSPGDVPAAVCWGSDAIHLA